MNDSSLSAEKVTHHPLEVFAPVAPLAPAVSDEYKRLACGQIISRDQFAYHLHSCVECDQRYFQDYRK